MGRATALEAIFRRQDSDRLGDLPENQFVIIVDLAKRAILDRSPGFFNSLFQGNSNIAYFLVTVDESIRFQGRRQKLVSRENTRHLLDISVECSLRCRDGNQRAVTLALSSGVSPESRLEKILDQAWIDGIAAVVGSGQDPCYDFFQFQGELEQALADSVTAETGLDVSVNLQAVGEADVEPKLEILSELFPVFVPSDRDLRLPIEVNSDFRKSTSNRDRALMIATRGISIESIADRVRHEIAEWFPKNVQTLSQFFTDQAQIKAELFDLLSAIAREFGRKVGEFDCVMRLPFTPPEFSRTEIETKANAKDTSSPIVLEHIVLLRIQDYSMFRNAPFSTKRDVDAWLSSQLRQIGEKTLINQTWLDVATRYDPSLDQGDESLGTQIEKLLRHRAANHGLDVVHFTTKALAEVKEEPTQFNVEHNCPINDWPNDIVIQHRVQLELVDINQFRRGGTRDIADWTKRQIESITRSILFKADYVDVVTRFKKEYEQRIREEVDTLVQAKGYRIEQFVSIPRTEVAELTEGFEKQIEAEFDTSDSREKVQLQIVVSGKLPDNLADIKSKLQNHLHPNRKLIDAIIKYAKSAAAETLHGITPLEFYLQFDNVALDSRVEGELPDVTRNVSVKHDLIRKIEARLEEQLGIGQHCEIVVKQGSTDLTTWLTEICGQQDEIEFSVRPSDSTELIFRMCFQVNAIVAESWERVLQLARSTSVPEAVKRISSSIRNICRGMLNEQFERADLEFREFKGRTHLQRLLAYGVDDSENRGVRQSIAQTYGVAIEIESFMRDPSLVGRTDAQITELAAQNRVKLVETMKAQYLQDLRELYKKRATMRESIENYEADDFESVDDQISKLESRVGVNDGEKANGMSKEYSLSRLKGDEVTNSSLLDLVGDVDSRASNRDTPAIEGYRSPDHDHGIQFGNQTIPPDQASGSPDVILDAESENLDSPE